MSAWRVLARARASLNTVVGGTSRPFSSAASAAKVTPYVIRHLRRDPNAQPSIKIKNAANLGSKKKLSLSTFTLNDGAHQAITRVGRGRGGGRGKTCGRGQKGQKARSSVRLGFEGGQTPLQKRLPKRNTYDPFARPLRPVELMRIQRLIDIGRLPNSGTITIKHLRDEGAVASVKHGVRLVGTGNFQAPVNIEVTETDPDAARAVLRGGGQVTLAWRNKLGLVVLLRPQRWTRQNMPLPRWARPPPKFQHRYPERTEDNLPIRPIRTEADIAALDEAWKRIIHDRKPKITV